MGRTKGVANHESNKLKRRLYEIYKKFGGRLTQAELARCLGVTRQYVSATIKEIDVAYASLPQIQASRNAALVDVTGIMAELREQGFTQRDLFIMLDETISRRTLRKWAAGQSRARAENARELETLLLACYRIPANLSPPQNMPKRHRKQWLDDMLERPSKKEEEF